MYVQGSKDKEITGLGALFDSAKPLYGLTRSSYPFLSPYTKAVDGAIDEVVIQKAIDRLEYNANSDRGLHSRFGGRKIRLSGIYEAV